MILLALTLALFCPHGGQYLPPLVPEGSPPAVLTQPGSGPTLNFEPARWEWWFDFHEEELLQLRPRLEALAAATEPTAPPPWVGVPDDLFRARILPTLIHAAERPQRDLRASAALALGRSRDPAALRVLDELVEDRDLFVRAQAILALGATRRPEALERLLELIDDKRLPTELFTYAVAALGLSGLEDAASLLAAKLELKKLRNFSFQERAALVHGAGLLGHAPLGSQLAKLADSWAWTQDADMRALSYAALGRVGDVEQLPLLLRGLSDKDNQVRRSAAAALGAFVEGFDDEQLAYLLRRHADENDVPARLNLLMLLGRSRSDMAQARLIKVLRRPAAGMERPFAALALGLGAGERAFDELLRAFEDSHEASLRGSIAVGFGLLGDRRALTPLRELLEKSADPTLQGWLCLALGLLGERDDKAIAAMADLLEQTHDAEALRHVAIGLSLLGEAATVAEALDVKEIRRPLGDRAALVFAAGQIGDARALPILHEIWSNDQEPFFLRRYALGAMGQIVEPGGVSFTVELSSGIDLNHRVGFLFELTQVY